jgi:hypothetical protein
MVHYATSSSNSTSTTVIYYINHHLPFELAFSAQGIDDVLL